MSLLQQVGQFMETRLKSPTNEQSLEQGHSPYAISKLSAEKYIQSYSERFDIKGLCLRLSNVYGARQNPKGEAGVIAIFARQIQSKEPIYIFGDGRQTRDYVHISDVVKAALKAIESDQEGIFNISTGIETSVNELAEKMQQVWPQKTSIIHKEEVKGEQKRSCLSYQKAKKAFGFEPETSLEKGLKKYYASLNEKE